MSNNLIWIYLLTFHTFTASLPLPNQYDSGVLSMGQETTVVSAKTSKYQDYSNAPDEKVISVRITSSIAIGRGKVKDEYGQPEQIPDLNLQNSNKDSPIQPHPVSITATNEEKNPSDVPPNLVGANIEYIKQLLAKKETKEHSFEPIYPFHLSENVQQHTDDESILRESSKTIEQYEEDIKDVPLARKVASTADANRFQEHSTDKKHQNPNKNDPVKLFSPNHDNATNSALLEAPIDFGLKINIHNDSVENLTISPMNDRKSERKGARDIDKFVSNNFENDDSVAESSIKSVEFAKYHEHIPLTVTMTPVHTQNNIQEMPNGGLNVKLNNPRLTTVSFNIVHDIAKAISTLSTNGPDNSFMSSSQVVPKQQQFYEPPKIYSEPAKIYSEPAKFYSEPAKIYSEPAKIYSEPAKIYSEPAKIYSEPSKFYSEPASLHLNENNPTSAPPTYSSWQRPQRPLGSTTVNTTPLTTATNTFQQDITQMEHQQEKNYEVDENISVLTNGRSHGVQHESTTEKCKQDNCKVGYVVEGRQFKKYRVEERTPDGFIVGEYGVVRNEDGALRGVRYTADSDASPRLIHDALMKFLQLK